MKPRDAWIVSHARYGLPINGEQTNLSSAYQSIVSRLVRAEPDQRESIFEDLLDGRPDRDEIQDAIDAIPPDAPAPPIDSDRDDGWEPMRLRDIPTVEPFPADILPRAAQLLVTESAKSIGCPADYVAVACLAAAGGVIGRSVVLRIKADFFASSSIWSVLIGNPSQGKTPAFRKALAGVRQIESALVDESDRDRAAWNESCDTAAKGARQPIRPLARRLAVDDCTAEALVIKLSENPRGLVMARDELSALINGMDQYKGGKGNDKAMYLKVWSGDEVTRDRVGSVDGVPIRVPHPCLSVVGGMTPDMLSGLLDSRGRKDGFIDRFLVTCPDGLPAPCWTSQGVDSQTIEAWSRLLSSVWSRPMSEHDGRPSPHVAGFDDSGKKEWIREYNLHSVEMATKGFPPGLETAWGKLREYAGRLALVLACMRHADDSSLNPLDAPTVDGLTVRDAWRLVDYFKSHAKRVHAIIGQSTGIGGSAAAQAVVKWIRDTECKSFTERDVKRARTWIDPDDLDESLSYLIERNAIRLVEVAGNRTGKGRPASPVYLVNPSLGA